MRRVIVTSDVATLFLALLLLPCPSALAVEAEFPEILAPLSWSITDGKVRELFPEADIQRTGYTGLAGKKRVITILSDMTWKRFGQATVHIDRDRSGGIGRIGVMTTETREECFEGFPPPRWCRITHGKELMDILEDLKKELVRQYGAPEEFPGVGAREADGLPPDKREMTYRWQFEGFRLFLSLTIGEDDYWAVELQAVRKP